MQNVDGGGGCWELGGELCGKSLLSAQCFCEPKSLQKVKKKIKKKKIQGRALGFIDLVARWPHQGPRFFPTPPSLSHLSFYLFI